MTPATDLVAAGIHPSWANALCEIDPWTPEKITTIGEFLATRVDAGATLAPAVPNIFRAMSRDITEARVLVIGQDPYPSPGHAVGLSFSTDPHVRPVPRSLQNIYAELHTDLGVPVAEHGDLSAWFTQGVILLNRVLSNETGSTGAHRDRGWEEITAIAINALIRQHTSHGQPLTTILWGRDARTLAPTLTDAGIPVVESTHPSPISASRGFFGSRPFSTTNDHLVAQGSRPIDWTLPTISGDPA